MTLTGIALGLILLIAAAVRQHRIAREERERLADGDVWVVKSDPEASARFQRELISEAVRQMEAGRPQRPVLRVVNGGRS